MALYDFNQTATSGKKLKPINRNSTALPNVNRLLILNQQRGFASITNQSNAALYLDVFSTVSSENYMVRLRPGSYYEIAYFPTNELFGVWENIPDLEGMALIREFVEAD